jgi:Protein of unknown function (DUF2778)
MMAWTYNSKTGQLKDAAGNLVGTGYSGHGEGVNNPDLESTPDVGPIPRATYTIGDFFDDPEKGPIVARLTPWDASKVFGRSGFMLHGDNPAENQSASLGCVIMPRDARVAVKNSGSTILLVIAP